MAVALPAATLPAVVEELLNEMAAAVRESARIPDEHLLSLKFIFGSAALQALDLVDRQSITLISSPSGRRVYQVQGSSGKTYTCLVSCHHCSCPAFAFSVLRKGDSLLVSTEGAACCGRLSAGKGSASPPHGPRPAHEGSFTRCRNSCFLSSASVSHLLGLPS
ncbi:zinc finger SWIM domain-containing protein 7 isoform X1 [Saccopteryx leptura]|uniref:zinc finger SWIM domain-containing protein 7 isoform X1 n=1 Tax=Saccopteryx leptura TaxID=249018 RepID=UPI00339BE252